MNYKINNDLDLREETEGIWISLDYPDLWEFYSKEIFAKTDDVDEFCDAYHMIAYAVKQAEESY